MLFGVLQGVMSGLMAQPVAFPQKLAPPLQSAPLGGLSARPWTLVVSDPVAFRQWFERERMGTWLFAHPDAPVVRVRLANGQAGKLLAYPGLQFADLSDRPAFEEATFNELELAPNAVPWVHDRWPNLRGQGLTVSVRERAFDPNDLDLRSRAQLTALADERSSIHATFMATIIGGAGNSSVKGKGVATAARFVSASFGSLLPDAFSALNQQGVALQNHSYGAAVNNYYGAEALAYDQQVYQHPELLHVFSAGNAGLLSSVAGRYVGLPGVSTLTGNFKEAKNVLVVTASNDSRTLDVRASRGPAFDGRVKPELTAYGVDGTSDAAALVSGVGLLIQQMYRGQQGKLPAAALIKAILVASSRDIGPKGIDFTSGYGEVQADRALLLTERQQFWEDTLIAAPQQMEVELPEGIGQWQLALAWADPPAQAGANRVLVHDLDVQVTHVESGQTWLPWVLNDAPHPDSLALPAVRRADHLNNMEFVTIESPPAGTYRVTVSHSGSLTAPQAFHIAHWAVERGFRWQYPTGSDALPSGEPAAVRWDTDQKGSARLEWSTDGAIWQAALAVDSLEKQWAVWPAPPQATVAYLRMITPTDTIPTERFHLSPSVPVQVQYVCEDEALVSWPKVAGVERYQLQTPKGAYLAPLRTTADTFAFVRPTDWEVPVVSVTPFVGDSLGFQGVGFNFEAQGVACFYRSLSALQTEGGVRLTLTLSTLYQVEEVVFERLDKTGFEQVAAVVPSQLGVTVQDEEPLIGQNRYRAIIRLATGREIVSPVAEVLYSDDLTAIVYPNPLRAGDLLYLFTNGKGLNFELYDLYGKRVSVQPVFSIVQPVFSEGLPAGAYIYRLLRNGAVLKSGRVLVY